MTRRSAGEGLLRQRPNGSWEARYVAADGRKRSLYRRTKREATEALREALGQADSGILPVDRRLTTGAYLADWLEHDARPRVRANTYRLYRWIIESHITPHIGRVPLAKLQPEHVQALLAADHGLGADGLRLVLTVLRGALKRAVRHGHVMRNVASLVDAPRGERRRVEPYTAEQATTLLRAAKGHEVGALVTTAIATGARLGELLALGWQDVDLATGELRISHTLIESTLTVAPTKTESSRRVCALPAFAVDVLREHRREQQLRPVAVGADWHFVFCGPDGGPLRASGLRPVFYELLAEADLPRKRFHDLRHAYASLQIEAGEELANISKALGHSNLSTTADIYAHLTPKSQRRMAETMDRILTG